MNVDFVVLLDIYGGILSNGQREALDLRYNSDLTLSEIAEEMGGISRQSVNDFLRKGEKRLLELERLLGNAARFRAISCELDHVGELLGEMSEEFGGERISRLKTAFLKIKEALDE